MSIVSQAIKNLKGGISQQPDILRFDDQGQEQVNCFSSEVEGLQKRPPSVHMGRLGDTSMLGERPLCHVINRDEQEQYAVFFSNDGVRVLDLKTAQWVTVNAPNTMSYATTGNNPRDNIRCVTVADYTFIVNKQLNCYMGGQLTPQYYDPERNALVVCSGGQYSRTFTININGGVVATYQTPTGESPSHGEQCDIQHILTKLKESFDTKLEAAGWKFHVLQGYAWIQAPDNDTISSLKITDGYNGKLLTGFRNDVQKTSELPVYAPANYQVRVSGEAGTDQDDYWVRFDEERNVWVEMAAPNIVADFNPTTMPHILVREGDGSFTFKQADWTHRASGDEETNPVPSFIGQNITDVFFFRNRLGFLSGENVVLSESGAYFNFFPPSVAVTSDSDPIDVAVSTNKISLLKYAVPFAEELLLWSDQSQFVLGADGVLSPTSVKLDMTTEFEVSDNARPYGLGRGVYFVSPRANFSSVRRYYAVQDVTSVKNAEDVTAHVPSYIPNGVFNVTGSSTENFLSILSEGEPGKVFMYKFLYLQEELAQQSWSHWDFGNVRILCAQMIGAAMYLVIDAPSGLLLEKLTFTQHTKDFAEEPFRLFMDRKAIMTIPGGTFDDVAYTTTIKLKDIYGSTPSSGRYYAVLDNGTSYTFDPPTGGWGVSDGALMFGGNLEGVKIFVGEAYTMRYQFSKFLIKSTGADGSVTTEDIGRLQLRRAWVNYEASGNFTISVDNQGRQNTYSMTGRRLGNRDFLIGESTLDTGQFRYPIGGNAQRVKVVMSSDTPNPVSIIGAGWEGNYVRRSSGI